MKHAIVYPGVFAGFLLGLAFILLAAFAGELGYGLQETLGLLSIAIAVGAAQWVAIRRHPIGPAAAFPARYFAAMLTGAVVSLVYAALAWFYFAVLNPAYLGEFYIRYIERAERQAETVEQRERLLANAVQMKEFVTDPASQAIVQFGTGLMITLLVAIAVAMFTTPSSRDA